MLSQLSGPVKGCRPWNDRARSGKASAVTKVQQAPRSKTSSSLHTLNPRPIGGHLVGRRGFSVHRVANTNVEVSTAGEAGLFMRREARPERGCKPNRGSSPWHVSVATPITKAGQLHVGRLYAEETSSTTRPMRVRRDLQVLNSITSSFIRPSLGA